MQTVDQRPKQTDRNPFIGQNPDSGKKKVLAGAQFIASYCIDRNFWSIKILL
jgi:hypothetical protein